MEVAVRLDHGNLVAGREPVRANLQLLVGPARKVRAHVVRGCPTLRLVQRLDVGIERERVRVAAGPAERGIHGDERAVRIRVERTEPGCDAGAHRVPEHNRPIEAERGDEVGQIVGVVGNLVPAGRGPIR